MDGRPQVSVGLAGWAYADWRDTVYRLPCRSEQPDLFGGPATSPTPRYARDELAFIAAYVDMIEINSSFYRVPSAQNAENWVRRAAARPTFFFTAKLHHEFTHARKRDAPLARAFLAGMVPLADAGLLRGFLAQFRYDFTDTPDNRALLRWITGQFSPVAKLIVEVRHRSWQSLDSLDFLRGLGVTLANLDYPTSSNAFTLHTAAVGEHAYLRLHGRNRHAWFSRDATVDETYDYDYSDNEIGELAARSRSLLNQARSLTVVANNHYRGKAVSTALRLKAELLDCKLPVPEALLRTYPALRRIAQTGGPSSE